MEILLRETCKDNESNNYIIRAFKRAVGNKITIYDALFIFDKESRNRISYLRH